MYTLYTFSVIGKNSRKSLHMAWPLAADNTVSMTSISSPAPLRLSHCVSPPLHNSASVSPSESFLLSSFFSSSSVTQKPGVSQGSARGQAPPLHDPDHHHQPVYPWSKSVSPDLGNFAPIGPRSRKESEEMRRWGDKETRWQGDEETKRRGDKETRRLRAEETCSVLRARPWPPWPPWQPRWLLTPLSNTDIMGLLIWYRPIDDCGPSSSQRVY